MFYRRFYVLYKAEILNIFVQGLLFSNTEHFKTTLDMSRLWVHEVTRVYGDKLVNADVGFSLKLRYEMSSLVKHFLLGFGNVYENKK